MEEGARRQGLVGLAQQLFFEFEDDQFLRLISEQIAHAYGDRLEPTAARAEVDTKIKYWNRSIELENKKEVHVATCTWAQAVGLGHKVPYRELERAVQHGYNGCRYCLPEYDTD